MDEGAGTWLVLALFETRPEGIAVSRSLSEGVATAVLALDPDGRPVVSEFGGVDEGSGVARLLGMIAEALLGGVMPRRTSFLDPGSELSIDDVSRIGAELEAGHAAVGVLERGRAAERAIVRLAERGGRTEVHRLTDRALRQVASTPPVVS